MSFSGQEDQQMLPQKGGIRKRSHLVQEKRFCSDPILKLDSTPHCHISPECLMYILAQSRTFLYHL